MVQGKTEVHMVAFHKDITQSRADKTVDKLYKDWADDYEDVWKKSYMLVHSFVIDELKKYVAPKTGKILDVACGTGLLCENLRNAGYRNIDGVDMVPEMLVQAEEKKIYNKLWVGRVSETDKIDAADNTYDGLVCVGALSDGHIPPKEGISEFIRVVKPGGYCVYTVNDMPNKLGYIQDHGQYVADGKIELILMQQKFHFFMTDKQTTCCHLCVIKVL